MKSIFIVLAKLNKAIMPSMKSKDLTRLSKVDKLIIGYRYIMDTSINRVKVNLFTNIRQNYLPSFL